MRPSFVEAPRRVTAAVIGFVAGLLILALVIRYWPDD
jgi:hypothetical protein